MLGSTSSPTIGSPAEAIRKLEQRMLRLEAQLAGIAQRQAAGGGPIKEAFFGVVTAWQKNKVSVCPMPFGDPNLWLTATYSEDNVTCNCFSPLQIFEKNITPVFAIRFWNTDRPIVIPIHLMTDDHDDPELPYWEPSSSEVEDPVDFAGGPPAFDDINCVDD